MPLQAGYLLDGKWTITNRTQERQEAINDYEAVLVSVREMGLNHYINKAGAHVLS